MKTVISTCIKTCSDNSEFLELHEYDIMCLPTNGSKIVETEKSNFISKIREYKDRPYGNKKYAIRKDSILGNYILNLPNDKVYNCDNIITFEKITNALNIAIFEDNSIYLKLIELFRNQVAASKDIIEFKYGLDVVNYIIEHDDFKSYLKKVNGTYEPTKYLVYDKGELSEQIISIKENQKRIKK